MPKFQAGETRESKLSFSESKLAHPKRVVEGSIDRNVAISSCSSDSVDALEIMLGEGPQIGGLDSRTGQVAILDQLRNRPGVQWRQLTVREVFAHNLLIVEGQAVRAV